MLAKIFSIKLKSNAQDKAEAPVRPHSGSRAADKRVDAIDVAYQQVWSTRNNWPGSRIFLS